MTGLSQSPRYYRRPNGQANLDRFVSHAPVGALHLPDFQPIDYHLDGGCRMMVHGSPRQLATCPRDGLSCAAAHEEAIPYGRQPTKPTIAWSLVHHPSGGDHSPLVVVDHDLSQSGSSAARRALKIFKRLIQTNPTSTIYCYVERLHASHIIYALIRNQPGKEPCSKKKMLCYSLRGRSTVDYIVYSHLLAKALNLMFTSSAKVQMKEINDFVFAENLIVCLGGQKCLASSDETGEIFDTPGFEWVIAYRASWEINSIKNIEFTGRLPISEKGVLGWKRRNLVGREVGLSSAILPQTCERFVQATQTYTLRAYIHDKVLSLSAIERTAMVGTSFRGNPFSFAPNAQVQDRPLKTMEVFQTYARWTSKAKQASWQTANRNSGQWPVHGPYTALVTDYASVPSVTVEAFDEGAPNESSYRNAMLQRYCMDISRHTTLAASIDDTANRRHLASRRARLVTVFQSILGVYNVRMHQILISLRHLAFRLNLSRLFPFEVRQSWGCEDIAYSLCRNPAVQQFVQCIKVYSKVTDITSTVPIPTDWPNIAPSVSRSAWVFDSSNAPFSMHDFSQLVAIIAATIVAGKVSSLEGRNNQDHSSPASISRAVYGPSTQDRRILHAVFKLTRPRLLLLLLSLTLSLAVVVAVVLRGTNAAATVKTALLLASLLAAAVYLSLLSGLFGPPTMQLASWQGILGGHTTPPAAPPEPDPSIPPDPLTLQETTGPSPLVWSMSTVRPSAPKRFPHSLVDLLSPVALLGRTKGRWTVDAGCCFLVARAFPSFSALLTLSIIHTFPTRRNQLAFSHNIPDPDQIKIQSGPVLRKSKQEHHTLEKKGIP
ncbi:uncharacterized protein CLUP02_03587 [Colletotrichum lupini]|uniref:Uncharacterized protein n=1 Tax=Colletotrichum lupini TaxID=145971 RepID=A0A9Q8WBY4_9PEZI|nr:uncharacterized protein CLUP02_03587 [Colletotrichum lupini]UQC78113.1 hypothetical protein CLUP02_03587 [Colletotrichum lupini]